MAGIRMHLSPFLYVHNVSYPYQTRFLSFVYKVMVTKGASFKKIVVKEKNPPKNRVFLTKLVGSLNS